MKQVLSIVAAAFGFAASCVLANVEVVDRAVNDASSGAYQSQAGRASVGSNVVTTTLDSSGSFASENTRSVEQSQYSGGAAVTQSSAQPGAPSGSGASGSTAEMFYQFQVMQQELLELRGLVEEQAHQIKQLKQQRLDDYVDLDRRLSALGGVAPKTSSTGAASSSSPSVPRSGSSGQSPVASSNDEKADYLAAIDPIIGTTKNLDLAISLLHQHLKRFPSGRFAGNAKYWLGESYLVKDNLTESRTWFEALLNDYPLHGKVPAAKFKLGIVYHKLGMNAQSRVLLEEVRSSGGPAASRAADYLDANF